MSFQELPQNIADLSLADPALAADVVDLCCFRQDRNSGCLTVLICDSGGRLLQPFTIAGVPRRCTADQARTVFTPLISFADEIGGGLVIAVGKPRGRIDDDDRLWHQRAIDACRNGGVTLLGAFVATGDRVLALPDPDGMAAAV